MPVLIILLAGAIAYAPSFNVPFLYDDNDVLLRPQAFGRAMYMRDLVTKDYFERFGERTYRPIMTLTFFADRYLWGEDPRGYHAVNLSLHLIVSVLVFLICSELGTGMFAALAGGLAFAVHPIQSEAVILASNREELLCGLFFFLSLLFYMRGGKHTLAGSVISFIFALFSKEMAASLPLILIAYDTYVSESGDSFVRVIIRRLPRYIPYLIVVIFFIFLRYTVFRNTVGEANALGGSAKATVLTMSYVFIKYIRLLFIPIRQCADYVMPILTSFRSLTALASVAFLATYVLITIFLRGRSRTIGFAMSFFLLSLLPVSNIIPFGATMADRYLYIPAFALCTGVAKFIQYIRKDDLRIAIGVLLAAVLILLTNQRAEVWRSDVSLWEDTVACAPKSAKAHINLGNAYLKKQMFAEAIGSYEKVISCDGEYERGKYYYNLGLAYEKTGKTERAKNAYETAVSFNSRFPEPYYHLAAIASNSGDNETGKRMLEKAIMANPRRADSYYIAARYALKDGEGKKLREAEYLMLKAVGLEPESALYQGSLGEIYLRQKKYSEAEKALLRSIRLDRGMLPSYHLLIELYTTTNRSGRAAQIESALHSATERTK